MPNAVDVSTIPNFNTSVNANFIHLRCIDYNIAFSNTLNRIRASCPNLTLYTPDFYALLTNMLAYPANYGLTNALQNGKSIDACDACLANAATNGPGTNYIFWDPDDPTAMVHMWMANLAQQLISPVQTSNLTAFNGSNQLDMANVPIGQNGLVLGRTNLSGELDRPMSTLHQHQCDAIGLCPVFRSGVVLPAEIPLLLDLAVARPPAARSERLLS